MMKVIFFCGKNSIITKFLDSYLTKIDQGCMIYIWQKSDSNKNNKQLRGKMKKYLLIFTILISMFSVVNVSQANAIDGAGVWAVVDNAGTVTNVISCTQSVCGGGTWDGQRVVPQIAPNPITNTAEGQGSFIGNEGAGIRVTESNEIFTIHENVRINNAETEVIVDDKNKTTITTLEVSVPVASRSFSYEDTIGKTYTEIKLKNESYDDSKQTNILITKETLNSLASESTSIVGRKTTLELNIVLVQNEMNLLLSKINVLLKLLGNWVK